MAMLIKSFLRIRWPCTSASYNGGGRNSDIESVFPYAIAPGSRPTNVIGPPRLDAASVGAPMALYDKRTFVPSVNWNNNAFTSTASRSARELLQQRPDSDKP